jgi:hypothetical protein
MADGVQWFSESVCYLLVCADVLHINIPGFNFLIVALSLCWGADLLLDADTSLPQALMVAVVHVVF